MGYEKFNLGAFAGVGAARFFGCYHQAPPCLGASIESLKNISAISLLTPTASCSTFDDVDDDDKSNKDRKEHSTNGAE
jgi:hypothetical protein